MQECKDLVVMVFEEPRDLLTENLFARFVVAEVRSAEGSGQPRCQKIGLTVCVPVTWADRSCHDIVAVVPSGAQPSRKSFF